MKPPDLQHVNVKLFLEPPGAGRDGDPSGAIPRGDGDPPDAGPGGDGAPSIEFPRVVEAFQRWVSTQAIPGVLLVDVADYRHVPSGPGILLVGLEADFSLDHTGGRWGLRYNRKSALEGTNEDRLRDALRSAARAGRMLESELASAGRPLRFSRNELEIFFNDRALAPNTDETWESVRETLHSALAEGFGRDAFSMVRERDPRRRFGVIVTAREPFDLDRMALETVTPA